MKDEVESKVRGRLGLLTSDLRPLIFVSYFILPTFYFLVAVENCGERERAAKTTATMV